MSHLPMQLPATLRIVNPPERPRPLRSSVKPYLIAGTSKLAGVLGVRPFVKLPCEEEDARITGSTRSLDRRLLALNLRGSMRISSLSLVIGTKIA
jgi:hypothetical protein